MEHEPNTTKKCLSHYWTLDQQCQSWDWLRLSWPKIIVQHNEWLSVIQQLWSAWRSLIQSKETKKSTVRRLEIRLDETKLSFWQKQEKSKYTWIDNSRLSHIYSVTRCYCVSISNNLVVYTYNQYQTPNQRMVWIIID